VVLAVVVQIGRAGWIALPFWIAIYRPEEQCRKGTFRTRHELAVEALKLVRSWFSGPITLLADGAYNNRSLVGPARELQMTVTTRIRSDARRREVEPRPQPKSKREPKPKHGAWLPRLSKLAREARKFTTETVAIYGKTVTLRLREVVAYWPPLGCAVKVVITRGPKRRKRIAYLMTTDLALSAVAVVEQFARRWTIEQLFSVAKNQMGFESAEVRKERSVLRHAALTMALVTFVEVWARRFGDRLGSKPFSAKLAAVREEAVTQTIFASGPRRTGSRRISSLLGQLFTVATKAA
jgi:SRSO17 transposase